MSKPVLFVQNITLEGPGFLREYLEKRNLSYEIVDLYGGQSLPAEVGQYGAVVVLGGPMNVYEETRYPYLAAEKAFIQSCIESQTPLLGICLGAQLLASVLGARVRKNEIPEIGWMDVELTPEGEKSLLFEGIDTRFCVFQWHGDTFAIPSQGVCLARSILCAHQAFSYAGRFFGVQFHLEIDVQTARSWAQAYVGDLANEEKEPAQALIDYPDEANAYEARRNAEKVFRNFFTSIAGYAETK